MQQRANISILIGKAFLIRIHIQIPMRLIACHFQVPGRFPRVYEKPVREQDISKPPTVADDFPMALKAGGSGAEDRIASLF